MEDRLKCKCDEQYGWCRVHVSCDSNCKALEDPVTFEEYKAAYEHWSSHSESCGCSHGC